LNPSSHKATEGKGVCMLKNISIGALIGFIAGIIFILFAVLYANYYHEHSFAAVVLALVLWIIGGGVLALIFQLTGKKTEKE
jgi:hypothetical protein